MSDHDTHREAIRRADRMPSVYYHDEIQCYDLVFDGKHRDKTVTVTYQRCHAIIDSYCEGTDEERAREVEEIISDSEIEAAR